MESLKHVILMLVTGSSQVNKLGRLCGRQEGKEYFSTGQSMFLTFHRDNNQTTGGFTLTYQAVSVPSVNWTGETKMFKYILF